MYIPEAFRVTDAEAVFSFIAEHDFATLISATSSGGVRATHVPLYLSRSGGSPVLSGHLARENLHWQDFDGTNEALAIFHGPHGYVSPVWYVDQPAVPTWNYAVAHAYGFPRTTDDSAAVSALLDAMVAKHEEIHTLPWRPSGLPEEFHRRMLEGIVAFSMPIDRLECKYKLGQNRSRADREGTLEGLRETRSPDGEVLASFMRRHAFDPA